MDKEATREAMLLKMINKFATQIEYALRKKEIPTRVDVTDIMLYVIKITEDVEADDTYFAAKLIKELFEIMLAERMVNPLIEPIRSHDKFYYDIYEGEEPLY